MKEREGEKQGRDTWERNVNEITGKTKGETMKKGWGKREGKKLKVHRHVQSPTVRV